MTCNLQNKVTNYTTPSIRNQDIQSVLT